MRFLIAGFGSIGRRHLRNLLELGERDIVLLRSQKSTLPTDEISEFPVETDLEKRWLISQMRHYCQSDRLALAKLPFQLPWLVVQS